MTPWNITGTPRQQEILREALDRIKFPWAELSLPGQPEMGWRDLNGSDEWWKSSVPKGARLHGDALHDGDVPHGIEVIRAGRRMTAGVYFPKSARIFVDTSLEPDPEFAMSVVGAEVAHAVDEDLITDAQRNAIMELWHKGGDDGHTWWEKSDYNAEYDNLGGEAFMGEFVKAYSDLPFDATQFGHHDAGCEPADIRRILGIERTDTSQFVRYGRSKVYHRMSHYDRPGIPVPDITGYRRCKTCKP